MTLRSGPSRALRVAVFLVVGAAALLAAAEAPGLGVPAIVAAVACFFLAATALSRAGQLAASLRSFRNRTVRVEVWGAPIRPGSDPAAEIDSIRAFGAGLLIHLRPVPEGKRILLKVAQPGSSRSEDGRFEIDDARYVSWGGKRLARVAGKPAVTILFSS